MGRQLTPAEMRQVNDAVSDIESVISKARQEHAQKQKEAACTSASTPSKSPGRAAA